MKNNNHKVQYWKVRYYDKNNKLISSHRIIDRTEQEAEKEAIAYMPNNCDDWSLMPIKPRPYYFIIWIEGLDYRDGEKIKSMHNNSIQYTTKMTEAMRILPDDIIKMKSILLNRGIAKWVVEGNTFIKTNYAPKGSIYKV